MKEKQRFSREEISLIVPSVKHERGRRKSRHDALGITPSDSLIDHNDKGIMMKNKCKDQYLFSKSRPSSISSIFSSK